MKTATIGFLFVLAHFHAWAEEPPATRPREVTARQIQVWIGDLAAEGFTTRETAQRQLSEMGKAAVAALSEAVANADPEVRSRAHRILFQMEESGDDETREAAEKAIRKFAASELDRIQYERAVKWLDRLRTNIEYEEGQIVELEIFNERDEVENDRPTDQELIHLRHLPALKKLTFHTYQTPDAQNITDTGLVHLGKLARLERLSIGSLAITDAGLASLGGMKSLKELWLTQMKVGVPGLVHLEKLPSLESLSLDRETVTKAHLEQLKQFKSLKKLSIYGALRAEGAKLDDEWLLHFNGFPHLKSLLLSLENTDITAAGVAKLKLTNMESLTLACGELRTIDLSGCKGTKAIRLSSGRLADFQGPQQLESLYFEQCRLQDSALAGLKNIPALKHFTLEATTVSAAGLAHLRELESLESVDFNTTAITAEVLRHLKEIKSLRSLSFADTFARGGLDLLKQFTSLEHLVLYDTGLSEAEAKVLQEALPNCTVHWDDSSRYAP